MPTLHWSGKDEAIVAVRKVPYRPLVSIPALGYGDPAAENLLIQGDNLDALKSLLPVYAGRVKCIFIDPPYNSHTAWEHYDDSFEHSLWLSMMYPRLELLRELLSEDGSIWVTIDDNEGHYLKVLMDEAFGRKKFLGNIVWQKKYARDNNSAIGNAHDNILLYAVDPEKFKKARNRLDLDQKSKSPYKNPNNDPRGLWQSISFTGAGPRPNQMYCITGPDGKEHYPPQGRHWATLEPEYKRLRAEGRFWFGQDGSGVPRVIRYLSEVDGLVPSTWWSHEETGHNDEAKKEIHSLFGRESAFDTPKPERLLTRIVGIATNPGDIVLDSFLGSATTAAVAHKMGRRWIGVEMGDHAKTHCAVRLRKVVDGEQGGISQAVNWQGGGGFRFCQLGEPVFDGYGRIRPGVGFGDLARWIWYRATQQPLASVPATPLLGVHQGTAYYLLFNGILGDRRSEGGNVLTAPLLAILPPHEGPRVIYGEACQLHDSKLTALDIRFRQLPYQANA